MTDYTRGTGSSGTMLIRDNWPASNTVEFWLNSNNSTTWSDHLPWGWTVNDVTGSSTHNYQPGAGWRRLGVFSATYSQNVTFRLGSTGTSGFGGPTTFTVFVQRSTVTPAPTIVTLSNITHNSVNATFFANGDGNSPTIEWQLGYGTNSTTPQTIVTYTTAGQLVSGLSSGVTYYFWGRGRNALGTGPWGPRGQATTLRVPDPPTVPTISNITQTTAVATFSPNATGGTPILEYQVGWSLSSTGNPTSSVTASSPKTITGLLPAKTYYFRTRARNAIGWSPWSVASSGKTMAGARVKVGIIWSDAVPYVKVDGVWVVAKVWVRVAGTWRETL